MKLAFKIAENSDLDTLLVFAQEFNREDHHPYEENVVRAGLTRLLADEAAGRAWLIRANGESVGYLILTLGYRLAYGRYAFIDEIYVQPNHRGQGIGRQALAWAEEVCRELEVKALHLEVEQENPKARALYSAVGFIDYNHYFLTCWVKQDQAQDAINSAEITFKPAQSSDLEELAGLRQAARGANQAGAGDRLDRLISGNSLGQAWLIQADNASIGYMVVTFSYSLEFHGRDALLDELYLPDPYRQNYGLPSLKFAQAFCQSLGVNALHVEMERDNGVDQALYRAAGFKDDDSYLMTKWVEA
jgi:GNAT superfamily N-acetyltransferase